MNMAKKTSKEIGPPENAIPPDKESPTILLQGDNYVATQWIHGKISMNTCFKKGDRRPAKNAFLVVEKSCGHHRKENLRFCAAYLQRAQPRR